MKKTKFLVPAVVATLSLPLVNICTSCGQLIVDDEIKTHDTKSWEHAIQHIASCKHPTFFLGQSAAYYQQQMASLFFASSQLAKQNGYTYDNPEYKLNDQVIFITGSTWNYKENKPGSESGYFAYNHGAYVDSNYNYSDIVKNSKSVGNTIDVTKGNQMLVTNLQDFDLSLDTYDSTKENYLQYQEWNSNNSIAPIINHVMDLYEEQDKDIKFNFVLPDVSWDTYFNQVGSNLQIGKLVARMFQKADKFYICSDGSNTWLNQVKNYKNWFSQKGYVSAVTQHQIWNKIHESNIDQAYSLIKIWHPWTFYNNESFFYHFQAGDKTSLAPSSLNPKYGLTEESTYKFSAPKIMPSSYANMFDNPTNYKNFHDSYLNLFNFFESGTEGKFKDYVDFDTYDNYDTNKKNIIFLLPGSFRSGKIPEAYKETFWAECKKIVAKINESYPIDQWNYIYKFHPGMSQEDIQATLKEFFGEEIPSNTIILKRIYPFEYLVALDQYLVKAGIESSYHLIDPTTMVNDKPNGILTGFDLNTTCFIAAMSMFVHEYGYSWETVNHLVQNDAFYIPKKFKIPSYQINGNDENNIEYNKNQLINFYKPFIELGQFPSIDTFKSID